MCFFSDIKKEKNSKNLLTNGAVCDILLQVSIVVLYAGVAEWQTRATQNREGNRGGSSPFTGTIIIKYL